MKSCCLRVIQKRVRLASVIHCAFSPLFLSPHPHPHSHPHPHPHWHPHSLPPNSADARGFREVLKSLLELTFQRTPGLHIPSKHVNGISQNMTPLSLSLSPSLSLSLSPRSMDRSFRPRHSQILSGATRESCRAHHTIILVSAPGPEIRQKWLVEQDGKISSSHQHMNR